jgi:hypothetical protein
VAAEEKKQEMDRRSTDYLRLKKEAIAGVTAAVQALADKEQSEALDAIAAVQKADGVRRQYADNYRSLQDKINAANGKNADVIQAESSIQDALNQKKEYENKLVIAKQSGVVADYSAAVKMIASWDIHINQLTTALDLTRRKTNLDAQGNADQIILNNLIAKGLDQEAFWLQKKIDLRNLEFQVLKDQRDYEIQIAQVMSTQNQELVDSLNLVKQIKDETNQTTRNSINDRQWSPATNTASGTKISTAGTAVTYQLGSIISDINAPFMGNRASGGDVRPYATYRINEDGTEYLTMGSKGGYITPAGQAPPGQNSAAPITIQGGITITLPNVTDRNTADELARAVWPKLQEYARRKAA